MELFWTTVYTGIKLNTKKRYFQKEHKQCLNSPILWQTSKIFVSQVWKLRPFGPELQQTSNKVLVLNLFRALTAHYHQWCICGTGGHPVHQRLSCCRQQTQWLLTGRKVLTTELWRLQGLTVAGTTGRRKNGQSASVSLKVPNISQGSVATRLRCGAIFNNDFIMAALCNRADHYIFAMWFLLLLSIFFFSSPNLSSHRLDAYFYTRCGPSTNSECRSEICCMRLAGNAGPKKSPKIRHLGTIAQLYRAISSQLRHVSTIGKKPVKQQCLPHMSLQYGEVRPTSSWDRFVSLGDPS